MSADDDAFAEWAALPRPGEPDPVNDVGRSLVEQLYAAGFDDIAYQLASNLDAREAELAEATK